MTLFHEIQETLAGHAEIECLEAVLQTLVVVIGIGASSPAAADALIDSLPGKLKARVKADWSSFRAHRQRSELRRQIEDGDFG